MIRYTSLNECVEHIHNNEIGIIKTDTLYGIVTRAHSRDSVERVYDIKSRDYSKPYIILVSDTQSILEWGITPPDALWFQKNFGTDHWPVRTTLIFDIPRQNNPHQEDAWEYLHRKTYALAFRVPQDPILQDFLAKTGPLIAPSANPQGFPPATSFDQACDYFGDTVVWGVDGGESEHYASAIYKITCERLERLR